jgi:hypothetical protein
MPWQASCRHNSIPMPVLPSCAPASPIHTSAYMIWSGTQTKTGDESACGGFPGLCRRLSEESYFELSARVPAVFRQHYARPVSSSSEAHCAAPWKKVSCRRLSRRSPSPDLLPDFWVSVRVRGARLGTVPMGIDPSGVHARGWASRSRRHRRCAALGA